MKKAAVDTTCFNSYPMNFRGAVQSRYRNGFDADLRDFARAGIADARYEMAYRALRQINASAADIQMGYATAEKLMEEGHSSAPFLLAIAHRHYRDLPDDKIKDLFEIAADRGNPYGYHSLGLTYLGKGREKSDTPEGQDCLRQAYACFDSGINLGHPASRWQQGEMLLAGEGVAADPLDGATQLAFAFHETTKALRFNRAKPSIATDRLTRDRYHHQSFLNGIATGILTCLATKVFGGDRQPEEENSASDPMGATALLHLAIDFAAATNAPTLWRKTKTAAADALKNLNSVIPPSAKNHGEIIEMLVSMNPNFHMVSYPREGSRQEQKFVGSRDPFQMLM